MSGPIEAEAAEEDGPAPLSYAQQRLWFLDQLQPGSAVYNVPLGYDITGPLHRTALEQALTEVVRRHEILRTAFRSTGGTPHQVVLPPAPVSIPVVDLTAPGRSADEAARLADEEAGTPFDLVAGHVIRARLLRLGEQQHRLLLTVHHLACDGASVTTLGRELEVQYLAALTGRQRHEPDLPMQYADFAQWQQSTLAGPELDRLLAYWRNRLTDMPARHLPTDHPRPPVQSYRGSALTFELPPQPLQRLEELGRTEGVTLYSVLLAAFAVLLRAHVGEDEVVVGTPVSGRERPELAGLIGFFTNTLVLRCDLARHPTFRELIQRLWTEVKGALAHQDLPFEKLVEELHPDRDLAQNPLFQVLFSYRYEEEGAGLRLDGCQVQPVLGDTGAARFDLTLSLTRTLTGVRGRLEYSTDLFEATTAERIAQRYVNVITAAANAPDRPVDELAVLPTGELATLADWQTGTPAEIADAPVHRLLAERVAATPDAVAVIAADATLTFRELDRLVDRFAAQLRRLGVAPDEPVGVHLGRTSLLMVTLLGILRAGAAYLPLDPDYPRDRLAFMVADAGVRLVVADPHSAAAAGRLGAAHVVIPDLTAAPDTTPDSPPPPVITPDNLAYVIYTSGSTGQPKGVMVTHRNVANLFAGMNDVFGADEPSTWLAVTSVSFDISVVELLWALTHGHRIVLRREPPLASAPAAESAAITQARTRPIDFSLLYFGSDSEASSEDRYRLLLEGAKFADRNGFTAVWTPERHFHQFGGLYPNPSVTAAAVAAITERVQIRAGSVVLPLHDPLRVAEEWSVVDNISAGRAGISFASGWHANDFTLAPDRYGKRKQLMMDGLAEVRRLWRGQKVTRSNGVGAEVEVGVFPKPVQPELPVWLTSAKHPETFRMAGEAGAGVLTHLLGHSLEELAEKIALYRKAWHEHGHGPGDGHVAVMVHTFVGPDLDEVRELVREPMNRYLETSFDLIASLGATTGSAEDFKALPPRELRELVNRAFDRFFATASLLGTPQVCADMVDRMKAAGVDEVACLIDFGVEEKAALDALTHLTTVRDISEERKNAALAKAEEPIAEQLREHAVTHLQCTPSLARALLADQDTRTELPRLSRLLVGGEALPADLARALADAVAGTVHNMYGPTEAAVWATTSQVPPDGGPVPIGRPLANVRAYVVDRDTRPCPTGVPGELLLGGYGVVRGYLNRTEATAERFQPDPFTDRPGARVYRTGDLARWTPDGTLEFLGRIDDQVKLHGHRIELGEIETTLAEHAGVRSAVAVIRGTGAEQRIIGYYVPATDRPATGTELRAFLATRLPGYMVPSALHPIDAMPLTPNKKVDRRALPDLSDTRPQGTRAYTPPTNATEQLVTDVWREVLGVDRVGLDDSFFDLGGNSLLVVVARARLLEHRDSGLSLVDMFRYPSARALAEAIDRKPDEGPDEAVSAGAARAAARRSAKQAAARRAGRAGA
ncbi:natural product biosynthesis luciferase-like monooxygenase protein [Streptomyces sp. LBL]|uniref:MupA/Atu3671 family FMN-dependent luciferase-like monooxygenase n=1 Tax=Streptomyces sp. LBL TaxID=2940562 RepID=UPI0024730371|nr:MupA/Atu3671 family FMN-dependent luciferase-like monooxygenase [Streptomyces sp. LBL]MDH6626449.1 natural product biosynthesis luciferase-like monooxygenase protein [Streptomyces sp. LBL]